MSKYDIRWGISVSDILTSGVILVSVVWLNATQAEKIEALEKADIALVQDALALESSLDVKLASENKHIRELMTARATAVDKVLDEIAEDVKFLARKERAK